MKRRLLLAVALGAIVAATPLPAIEFLAMGDSITAGSSYPLSFMGSPVIFDCIPGCAATASGRDQCGHVRRLESWIDGWMGAGQHLRNKGVGGEKTMAGVNRLPLELDALCGTPGDCNAVLLMHGTNDMYGSVSPESARDNLALMIAEARSRNIDTLLMTIIRRGYDPGNANWRLYRDLTLALADDEGLQRVDVWESLCAGGQCFDDNYWLSNQGPCFDPKATPDPGHLDPDGYDVLTGLVQAAFPAAAPAAPAPASPAGDIADGQPDFVWPEVAGARWYELQVDGASSWWEAAAHCAAGSCTADPGVPLAKGAHSWRVRGRNLRGLGGWSAATGFTVWGIPGTPLPSQPEGLYVDGTPMTAPFAWEPYVWSADPEATDYDLVVSDGGGPVMLSFDSSICDPSTCTAAPAAPLDAGDHSWTVQARNPALGGPPSGALAFEIWATEPTEPTPSGPTGDFFEPFAPLYEWLPAAGGVTEYDLEVEDSGGDLDASIPALAAATVCSAGLCSHQGAVLADPDGYTLRVRARNAIGDGMLSTVGADFTILACDDPSQKDLSEFLVSGAVGTATVPHCGPLTAAAAASFEIEPTADLAVHTRDGFAAFDGLVVRGRLRVRSP